MPRLTNWFHRTNHQAWLASHPDSVESYLPAGLASNAADPKRAREQVDHEMGTMPAARAADSEGELVASSKG